LKKNETDCHLAYFDQQHSRDDDDHDDYENKGIGVGVGVDIENDDEILQRNLSTQLFRIQFLSGVEACTANETFLVYKSVVGITDV
jgi:hypothetical protein